MTDHAPQLARELRAHFTPRVEQSVVAVAEAEFILPPSVTQNAGHYSTWHCWYLREMLEDFNDDTCQDSTNCFGAQTFKTTGMFVGVGFRISKRPANILYLLPTFEMAQTTSETKWMPMVEETPALRALIPSNVSRYKKRQQQFKDCNLWFVGSGAEKNLKSRSAEIIIVDEADDVEAEWLKKGKSAIGLVESRKKSYAGGKIFITGTPQEVNGVVWTRLLEGDRRLYFVTCPACQGEPFAMEFDPQYTKEWFPNVKAGRVVWDKGARRPDGTWDFERVALTARMECPNCKARLEQHQIPDMVRGGQWKPTCAAVKRSRRLPSLYSPHENTTLAKLAVKFLQDQFKPGGVRNFLNEELALPYQPKASTTTVTEIRDVVKHSPSYLRGEIPRENIALLSLTVDVNQGLFHWLIRAWFSDASSALVDYGPVLSWGALTDVSKHKYRVGSIELAPMFCLIDSGWRTKSEAGVYEFCLKSGGRFLPVKGATKNQGLKSTVEESTVDFHGQAIRLIRFDEPVLKYDLYFNKIKKRDSKFWLPVNTGKDYEEQLTDEYMKPTPEGAKWEMKTGNNHLGDCEKEQLIIPSLIEGIAGMEGFRRLAELVKQSAKLT